MTQHYMLGILVLVACLLLEVSTFPSHNESTTSAEDLTEAPDEKDERSLTYNESNNENDDATKDIIKKIAAINEALKKPNRRHPGQWNAPPTTNSGYILDKDILEKLQQVIASGKLHPYSNVKQQETNAIINEDLDDIRYSRQISPLVTNNQMTMTTAPTAYITSMPVLVLPGANNMNGFGNSIDYAPQYQGKQNPSPSQPFQPFQPFQNLFQWPFAQLFPILIRDPLLSVMNGGGFQNFIEVGQSADVCKRLKKSEENDLTEQKSIDRAIHLLQILSSKKKSRARRAVKKRTVSLENQLQDTNKAKKFFATKPFATRPTKPEPVKNTKTTDEGDLRFPFHFGQKDETIKTPPGNGIFINKLRVRKGGVAIAGPGGVATAGNGGTAIVGPGGLAYTQPGGLAVAGPAARVIALSSDADLTSVAHRLQQQSIINGSVSQLLQAIPEGKLVATDSTGEPSGSVTESGADMNTENSQTYTDTTEESIQYLPFYGGARGQYLEIKKDNSGRITSEKIVSEENISSENMIKNSDGNLLAKVMVKNLQNLKTYSTSLLKLTNLGRKTGSLGKNDKARYEAQLASLGEASSNIIKLIEEVDDVDKLFKKNTTTTRNAYDADDDYVSEEGVGIEAAYGDSDTAEGFNERGTIAEAKPVGLAVIGEHGLAASRPHATAIALNGAAIASPIATAIAGINPELLGINISNMHSKH